MQTNRYNSTGFAPTNIPSKSVPSYTDIPDNIKTIERLAEDCRRRAKLGLIRYPETEAAAKATIREKYPD